ncbi:M12 family metallo-peptidase [Peristeroidobacter agariperforans]|uniref:M12 family metallo-peptidase n=1 Tax=Peristeroidobacter agariperforans TaxID=268404 RepID=UPI0018E569C2|nr:M12 family metallo-peptidase [Peristeroidobacter agariperforans]
MGGSTRSDAIERFGGCLHWLAAAICSGVTGCAFALDRADSQILYFEPVQLAAPSSAAGQQKSSQARELQFDAYGRRFVVTLEPNDKLSSLLQSKSGSSALALYRGRVNGASGSWARLSMADGKIQGMLWDGAELYVIEPVDELQDSLPANTSADPNATAIFRLKDVVMTAGAASCGSDTSNAASKGSDAYNSMLGELKGSPAIMQAVGATKRLEISALGDGLFMNRFGDDAAAREEILRRLNNVDGIFSSQLGIEISVPSIDIGDSLSATTSASSLLDELGDLRKRSRSLNSRGLTHLFTGRNLDGSTVGIAFVGSVCDRQYGAGLTESSNSRWVESLIAAHEIAHSLGAPHDGDASQACGGVPAQQYLMASAINGNDKFSACSLSVVQSRVASASCITALPNADVEVDGNLGSVQRSLDKEFSWSLTVRNGGGMTTANARAEIALPSDLTIVDASVSGGTCTSGAGLIMCELGQIPGGNSAIVNVSLRSAVAMSRAITVEVSAANDNNPNNNHGTGTIITQAEVDLAGPVQAPSSDGGVDSSEGVGSSGGGGGAAGPGFLALLFGLLCLKNLQPTPTRRR